MGKIFQKYKWMQLFLGLLLLVAGIITVIVSIVDMSILSTTLSIIIAVVLFAFGGFMILASIMEDRAAVFTPSLVYGSIIIAVGVILCVKRGFIGEIVIYLLSVFAIALGVSDIVKAAMLIKYHGKTEWIIISFLIAFLAIGLGVTCLVIPGKVLQAVYISFGVLFIVAGVFQTVYGSKKIKQ